MKLIVTKIEEDELYKCWYCDTLIATIISGQMAPNPEECYAQGKIDYYKK